MNEIKVTFSDGSAITFHEEQTFRTIEFFSNHQNPQKNNPSKSETFGLWAHIDDGLVPSFMEIIANSNFFYDVENPKVYYNAQSVVKVEII